MTLIQDIDKDKAMATADIIAKINKAKEQLNEHLLKSTLKEAPFQMKLNGILIIQSDVIPQGSIVVPKEFADLLFTAYADEAQQ